MLLPFLLFGPLVCGLPWSGGELTRWQFWWLALAAYIGACLFLPLLWLGICKKPGRQLAWIEFHDQPWCPAPFRHFLINSLAAFWNFYFWTGLDSETRDKIRSLAELTSSPPQIVEVCAGAGGGIEGLLSLVPGVQITLTDLFPELAAWKKLAKKHDSLKFESKPVNAMQVDPGLKGLRMIRGALHHFTADQIQVIIQDAVDSGQPFGVLDIPTDRVNQLWFYLITTLSAAYLIPHYLMQLWTERQYYYLLSFFLFEPLFIFGGAHDGTVSALRAYSTEELHMIASRVRGIEKCTVEAFKSTGNIVGFNVLLVAPRVQNKRAADRDARVH